MSNLANVAWQHIYFKPWIGKNYAAQEFKIMNLTESHYVWDDVDCHKAGRDLLCNTILDHVNGHHPVQTYNNAKAVVTGDYKSDNHKFWDRTVMHTYFQELIGIGNHRSKSLLNANRNAIIEQARNALFELMNHLKKVNIQPDLIIVWGKGWGKESMRRWLPEGGAAIDKNLDLWQYSAFPETFFWFIKHPSSYFKYDEYHIKYKEVRGYLCVNCGKAPFNPLQFI